MIGIGERVEAELAETKRKGPSMRKRVIILGGFCTAQLMDIATTHIGLSQGRQELNGAAAWIIAHDGELAVYVLKLGLVGGLVALLFAIGRSRPVVWNAYLVAAFITTFAVINNIYRILT
ncbi:MAG TPA: DUF5658 family protein [Candidatus Limnocylindrales bacterium]|nr:DUF5658 family protein [Candidatus Limnocylindrales bacterium]